MQSRLLSSFLVVAEKASITEAANVLHVSQPALTKSMQQLEADLGVKLFDRIAVGVRLTKYGEVLQRHVKVMDNEYQHAVARLVEMRDGRSGALRVGAGPVWLVSILPPIISRFQEEHPDVSISLIGGVIDTLVPSLINGELDLICVSLDFPNRSEIVKQQLFNTRHILVADASHPLAGLEEFDAEALHAFPWTVLKSDYVGTERLASFFSSGGLKPPRITFETTSINSLLHSVKGGQSIAHIPEQMLPLAEGLGLCKLRLAKTIWETRAGYAYRATGRLTDEMRAFIRLLDAHVEQPSDRSERPLRG